MTKNQVRLEAAVRAVICGYLLDEMDNDEFADWVDRCISDKQCYIDCKESNRDEPVELALDSMRRFLVNIKEANEHVAAVKLPGGLGIN